MKCDSTAQHSNFLKINLMNKIVGLLIGFFLIGISSGQLQAQMFSVGDQGPRFNVPETELYVGLEPMKVTYKGSSIEQGAGVFEFEGPIIRLGYESSTVNFFLGSGGSITGIDEASYFDTGGNIDFGINIYRSKELTLQVPVRIASRYTNITNSRAFQSPTLNRFRFGSLTAGAGVRVVARPWDDIRFKAGAVPNYGFAFASDGFFGGSLGEVAAHSRLYFDRLFGDIGLTIGYRYDLRSYDIDENLYDYKMNGHILEVGITF
jgi:hypothetical protein